ncbi:MAG: hypothetical protein WBA63_07685 [Thermomicrobiales bacterium]
MAVNNRARSATIKIQAETHRKLQEIARSEDRPMGEVVTRLADEYEHQRFWHEAREQIARLKADPVAWKGYLDEMAEWDGMPNEVLDQEEPYYSPDEEREILADAARTESR